ncbi:MAG: tannase/feruloyl esterase family alpha/beta hydrolase [Polyangiales bacterium]
MSGLRIVTTEDTPASYQGATEAENYPAHCVITGKLNERTGSDGKPYAIGFELRLPTPWNRRFFFQGGGGSDGFIVPALGTLTGGYKRSNALSQGFAVVAMDGGHVMEDSGGFLGGGTFGLEPDARIDYGYRALGTMTVAAKQIVEAVYGLPIERSYFVGCSNGGRQGMVAAARFAEQFDGIVAGNPGFQLPRAAIQHAWDYQQLSAVDTNVPDAFTPDELALIGASINAKCDALDGVTDELVQDAALCGSMFDSDNDIPGCQGDTRTGRCLTAKQKLALRNIMAGPVDSQGQALYSDWPWDAGLGSEDFMGWRGWKLGIPLLGGFSLITTGGAASLAYIFTTPPTDLSLDPRAALDESAVLKSYLTDFDFDRDAPKIYATSGAFTESAMSFMTPPDGDHLTSFAAKSGKLIVYHGAADPVFSANDTRRWYEDLSAKVPDAASFARLFLVPGMAHCGGGPTLDSFDLFAALVDWVEHGVAPEAVVTRVNPDNTSVPATWPLTRTRLLCPHPLHAQLTAADADTESAASFGCK